MSQPNTLLELIHVAPAGNTAFLLPEAGIRVSYDSLRKQVGAMADDLASMGIGRGDRVATVLPNGLPAVVSFLVEGAHAHDLATLLDLEGVAVRSGHHCAHPLMQFFGVPATCRASLAFYNTHAAIAAFIAALLKVRRLLG